LKKLLIILSFVIILLIAILVGPWLLLYLGISMQDNPPKPAITYGEFPFHLEYKFNNQLMVIDDTVIVKFDGFEFSEGSSSKYVSWKQTLASGNKEVVLYKDGETSLIFSVGIENYHLEDQSFNVDTITPDVNKKVGRMTSIKEIPDYELRDTYNLELIKFNYGEPLKK